MENLGRLLKWVDQTWMRLGHRIGCQLMLMLLVGSFHLTGLFTHRVHGGERILSRRMHLGAQVLRVPSTRKVSRRLWLRASRANLFPPRVVPHRRRLGRVNHAPIYRVHPNMSILVVLSGFDNCSSVFFILSADFALL